VNPHSFNLIGTHACECGKSNRFEVTIDEFFREAPHCQAGGRDMFEQNGLVASHGYCRVKLVG
jgi:hypothetical protein